MFPRVADLRDNAAAYPPVNDLSTGIAALDEALEEGYWSGSTTLIAGPSGAGKSLMGLHFVFAGAAQDEPGIFVTLQENRTQLARVIGRFGWSIDQPNVTISAQLRRREPNDGIGRRLDHRTSHDVDAHIAAMPHHCSHH